MTRNSKGYNAIHQHRLRTYTKTGACQHCKKESKTQWANISGDYRKDDISDWLELCPSCHGKFDSRKTDLTGKNLVHKDPQGRVIKGHILIRLHQYPWWTDNICNPELYGRVDN